MSDRGKVLASTACAVIATCGITLAIARKTARGRMFAIKDDDSVSTKIQNEDVSDDARARPIALVLTSHPDDESYFFAPTIQFLRRSGRSVHLVCLSDGAAGGDGEERKRELLKAKEALEIEALCVVETEDLRDGMDRDWPRETVMAVLDAYEEGAPGEIESVVTFDGRGVSGHINHVATHEGAKMWIERKKDALAANGGDGSVPRVLVLETTNIARKYSGALDAATSYLTTLVDSRRAFIPCLSLAESFRAVRAHKSQFVWYRKLFFAFSRYTYLNTLRRID